MWGLRVRGAVSMWHTISFYFSSYLFSFWCGMPRLLVRDAVWAYHIIPCDVLCWRRPCVRDVRCCWYTALIVFYLSIYLISDFLNLSFYYYFSIFNIIILFLVFLYRYFIILLYLYGVNVSCLYCVYFYSCFPVNNTRVQHTRGRLILCKLACWPRWLSGKKLHGLTGERTKLVFILDAYKTLRCNRAEFYLNLHREQVQCKRFILVDLG